MRTMRSLADQPVLGGTLSRLLLRAEDQTPSVLACRPVRDTLLNENIILLQSFHDKVIKEPVNPIRLRFRDDLY